MFFEGSKKRRGFSGWALLISLVIHSGFLFLKWANTYSLPQQIAQESLIELSEVPPRFAPAPQKKLTQNQPKNQIVETEDALNREIDPNATMWSDKNQRAQKNTKASLTDDFRKGSGSGKPDRPPESSGIPQTGDQESEEASPEDISMGLGESSKSKASKGVKRNWKTLSLKDLSVGTDEGPLSASDDYLPHVEAGERTILSTREFRYFSYYNRIKDLLRQFWKPSIEREVAKLWGKGQMLRENELTTRVLVLLDKTGQIQKVSKVGASGISEIDEAAVQAFYQAAPFPNPPAGLVDTDGFVRINWDFILQTAAAPRIQFRPSGGPRAFR